VTLPITALELDHVQFGYSRRRPVLRDLALSLSTDSAVLLGPNGAGKSTLIGLIAAVLEPWSGSVRWAGVSSTDRSMRSRYRSAVGWVPQHIETIPGFTVGTQVAYAGWLKGLSKRESERRTPEILERVLLAKYSDQQAFSLSGGQRRRLGIAQALIHDAELIVMDEPTAGLDPHQRKVFRGLVAELRTSTRLLISTHQTEDLAELGREVVVLTEGQVLFRGAMDEFLALGPASASPAERAEIAYVAVAGDVDR
jgi:ABC-2 type transport system ATP-binding protein